MNEILWTLPFAAATVGALHTVAPDHWMPFAVLARVRGWTPLRTARTTMLCAFGHVTVTAALGLTALFIGLAGMEVIGGRLADMATKLLMVFGAIYFVWGLRRSLRRDPLAATHAHDHHHARGHHDHDHGLTEWSLFLLFSSDPCVALIPMIVASAGSGWPTVLATVVAYEIATMTTMTVLAITAHVGARALRVTWFDRFGHAIAGAVIVCVGAAMAILGI
jgi:nickel/cobalt exporter